MPIKTKCKIIKKEKLIDGIYKFNINSEEIAKTAKPGNFLEIKVSYGDNTEPFLRRPISVYNIDRKNGIVEFIFQVKGRGTKMLSEREVGDTLDILRPTSDMELLVFLIIRKLP